MIVYSHTLNSYSNHYLIKHIRKNKWFWRHKFFFEHLSKIQYLKLIKSLIIRSHPIVFVQLEGIGHHWYYKRPTHLADIVFGYRAGQKHIYWNQFLDDVACGRHIDKSNDYKKKTISNLIPEVCFVSSNTNKINALQKNYPELYKNLDIYGEFHAPIGNNLNLTESRHVNALLTTSKYIASLCIENYEEEGYAQGSALWSLSSMTPPILKASPIIKNFIRSEFYINFDEYIKMSNKEKIISINKLQEFILTNDNYLTNLTKDYINFFSEAFSDNNEPDLKKIIHQSQSFRKKFITI